MTVIDKDDLLQIADAVSVVFLERLKDTEAGMLVRLDAGLQVVREEWQKALLDTAAFRSVRDDKSFTETIDQLREGFKREIEQSTAGTVTALRSEVNAVAQTVESIILESKEKNASVQKAIASGEEQIKNLEDNLRSGLEDVEHRSFTAIAAIPAPAPLPAFLVDSELTEHGRAFVDVVLRAAVQPALDASAHHSADAVAALSVRLQEFQDITYKAFEDVTRAAMVQGTALRSLTDTTVTNRDDALANLNEKSAELLRHVEEECAARGDAIRVVEENLTKTLERVDAKTREDLKVEFGVAVELAGTKLYDTIAADYTTAEAAQEAKLLTTLRASEAHLTKNLETTEVAIREDLKVEFGVAIELAGTKLYDTIAADYTTAEAAQEAKTLTVVHASEEKTLAALRTSEEHMTKAIENSDIKLRVEFGIAVELAGAKLYDTIAADHALANQTLEAKIDSTTVACAAQVDELRAQIATGIDGAKAIISEVSASVTALAASTATRYGEVQQFAKDLEVKLSDHKHEEVDSLCEVHARDTEALLNRMAAVGQKCAAAVEGIEQKLVVVVEQSSAALGEVSERVAVVQDWQVEHQHADVRAVEVMLKDEILSLHKSDAQAFNRLSELSEQLSASEKDIVALDAETTARVELYVQNVKSLFTPYVSAIEDVRSAAKVELEAAVTSIESRLQDFGTDVEAIRAVMPTTTDINTTAEEFFNNVMLPAISGKAAELKVEIEEPLRASVDQQITAAVAKAVPVATLDSVQAELKATLADIVQEAVEPAVASKMLAFEDDVRATAAAAAEATHMELRAVVADDVRSTLSPELKEEIAEGVRSLRAAVDARVSDTVGPAVLAAVPKAVTDIAPSMVLDTVNAAMQTVHDAIPKQIADAVGPAVLGAVGPAVAVAVGPAVGDALPDAVSAAVAAAVGPAVALALPGAVGPAVALAVPAAAADALPSMVAAAVAPAVVAAADSVYQNRIAPVLAELEGVMTQLPEIVDASVASSQDETVRLAAEKTVQTLEPGLYQKMATHVETVQAAMEKSVLRHVEITVPPNIENLESKLMLGLLSRVESAIERMPKPKDGKNARFTPPAAYELGKSYRHSDWVAHSNGLWVAARDTGEEPSIDSPCWDCIAPGISNMEVVLETDGRTIVLYVQMANGKEAKFPITLPIPVPKDVYAEGTEYNEKDWVTHAGAMWEAKKSGVLNSPGTDGSWKMVIKKGQDGKAARPAPAAAWRFLGDWEFDKLYHPGDIISHAGPRWLALKSTRERPPFVQLVSNDVWQKLSD